MNHKPQSCTTSGSAGRSCRLRESGTIGSLSRCNCLSSGERNDFEIAAYERTVRAFLDSVDAEYAAVLGLLPAAVTP